MPLDYLSELKESCAIAKSRSLTVTRATKITNGNPPLGFGLNYKRAVVGNLLKDRHNVERTRRDLCFVHAHLSTKAKIEN